MDNSELSLTVPGMGSDHCAGIVSSALQGLDGVQEVQTNIADHQVRIVYVPDQVDAPRIRQAVKDAGYDVTAVQGPTG